MTGNVLIWLALAASAFGFGSSLGYVRTKNSKMGKVSKYSLYFSVASLLTALVLLAYYFVTSNLGIEYVLSHTKVGYPLKYKIAGIWAGDAGAILFWSLVIGLATILYDRLVSRKMSIYTRPFSLLILLVFTIILVKGGLFDPTPEWALAQYPHGYGMKPLLTTNLMIVHPPLQLLGYGLTAIPLIGALSFLIYDRDGWASTTLQFTRAAWLFYGLGIGIGALWAYFVLGWGGYWGWDPVENADLMGWLALTPLLHVMKRTRDRGDYRYLTPGLAAFAFVITIFAAFATRAGVLGGVHQFAGGPGAELARLLSGNWILSNITRLLAVGSLMLTSLVTYKYSKEKGFNSRMPTIYLTGMGVISLIAIFDISAFYEIFRELSATIYPSDPFLGSVAVFGGLLGIPVFLTYSFSEGENGKFKIREILEDKYTILLTVGLLFLGTLVILILMGMGAGGVEDQAAFNSRLPYFTIPLALALIICSTRRPFGIRGVGYAIGIAIFAGLVTFGIFQGLGLHGFELGVYAVAVAAPISKIDSLMGRRGKGKLRVAGLLLLIAGILGIILWSSNPESAWPFIESAGLPLRTSMVILSTIALLGGFSAYRRASWRLSLLGALAGIVTFSIWVGAAISLFALLMIALKRREFTRDGFSFSRLRPLMRVSSHHLIHVGLALLLVGFVLSTYMEREDQIETLGMGEEKSALGYDFKLTGSGGRMDDRGMIEEVYAELAISGGGLSKANLSMEWWTGGGIEPHMMKQVAVTSKLKEDIYLIPNAFWTPSDGWKQSMSMSKFRSSDVQAVSFEVRTLPGMNVLWGGMWIMMVSIGMLIATEVISKRETEKRKVKRWEEEYRKEIFG